ncbi:unnamed protein product [Heterobilharzia americana]|nr:unnamed protein product [Heterobilharzia americana]
MFRSCEIQFLAIFTLFEYLLVQSIHTTGEMSSDTWLVLKVNQANSSSHQILSDIIQSMANRRDLAVNIHYAGIPSTVTINCIVFYKKSNNRKAIATTVKSINHDHRPIIKLTCPLSKEFCFSDCLPSNQNVSDISCNYLSFYQKDTDDSQVFHGIKKLSNFPYQQINVFRYTLHQLDNKLNGNWACHSEGHSSEIHELVISNSSCLKNLSADYTPFTLDTPIPVICDTVTPINADNFTVLRMKNSLLRNEEVMDFETVWYVGTKMNPSTSGKNLPNSTSDNDIRIECQMTDAYRRRTKRQTDFDAHYPSKSVRLNANISPDNLVQVGTVLEIKCTAEPGNPPPRLSLLRQRFEESKATVIQTKTMRTIQRNPPVNSRKEVVQEFAVTLSEEDNGASFFCEVASTGITETIARSDSVRYNVSFPPRAVYVQSYPEGLIPESTQKTFSCQTDSLGSNPAAILRWQQLDSAGAVISLESLKMSVDVDFITQTNGAVVTRSNLTILATRALNGRRFECSVVFNDSKTMLRSEGFLEVMFSPNNIRLTAQPINGVPEASRLELTCATSSCHPPAVIRWLEIPPDKIQEKNKKIEEFFQRTNLFSNELTDLAQLETKQGDFGGTKVSSTLIITKTYRSHQNTIYQCLVNHTGMNKPVLSEHRLQILYPPSIHIISLPNQPIAKQSVSLFCQAIGGNPSKDLTYAWFVTKSTQFSSLLKQDDGDQSNNSPDEQSTNNSPNLSTLPNHFISSQQIVQRPEFASMIQLTGYHDSQLNLTNIKLSQAGWYGCEVSGAGGSSHALYHLDLYYQPIMNRRTQTQVMAQVGESVTLALYVDANPPWAEAEWFQIDTYNNELGQIRNPQQYVESQAYFESQYLDYDYPNSYDSWPRVKRTTYNRFPSSSLKPDITARQSIGQKAGQRKNIFASRGTGLSGNLTFLLRFSEVKSDDFGTYICQVRHQLGVKDFMFHLIKKSGVGIIAEDSIEIIHHGSTTSILFSPPMKSSFTRLILRVCRRDAFIPSHLQPDRLPMSKRHLRHDTQYQKVIKRAVNIENTTRQDDILNRLENTQFMVNSRTVGCEDYNVAKPWLGKMEVHLSDAIQLYNFRFLLFQGAKLLQETSPILWQPEIAKERSVFSKSLLALAVSGGCVLVIVFLITTIIFYTCYGRNKRNSLQFWNIKKSLKSSTSHISSKKLDVPNPIGSELGFELHSDLESVRRYQPETTYKQQATSGSFISHGYESSLNGIHHHFGSLQTSSGMINGLDGNSVDNECAALLHSRNSVASSQSAQMNIINSRIFAEAYAAAARAAASVVSGSTDIYSPSTQMTNDLGSQTNEERHKSQNSLTTYPTNTEMNSDLMTTSKETNMSGEGWKKHNNSITGSMCLKNRDKRKALEINKFKNSLQGARKSSRLSLSGHQPEPHGSHLSVHLPSKHPTHYSQWSNASGTSYSSLVSPSQTDLQVAAQVAAAAAVASVVENMNFGLAMNHASSLNNVGGYCLMPRPSSRAASVTGPPSRGISRPGTGSEDEESMKFAIFTPRNTSTGQATPTASVDTNIQISTPSPTSQQQQFSNDPDNSKSQSNLNNQQMNPNITSQYVGMPMTRSDDRNHQSCQTNRLTESQNIGNSYMYSQQQPYCSPSQQQQQQLYAVHGVRGPYSTFINSMNIAPTIASSSPSPNINANEQNASLMAYYRILAQNQILNRHKLQQFHQYQLLQQQRQQQHIHQNKNDQLKHTFNMNKLQQQVNTPKNSTPDSKDKKHYLEHSLHPNQQIEFKSSQESNQFNKTNQFTNKHFDETNNNKSILVIPNNHYSQKDMNKDQQNSSLQENKPHVTESQSPMTTINQSDKSVVTETCVIHQKEMNQPINFEGKQNHLPEKMLNNLLNKESSESVTSNESPSFLLDGNRISNPTDINNNGAYSNNSDNNTNNPLCVTTQSESYYDQLTHQNRQSVNDIQYNDYQTKVNSDTHSLESHQTQSSAYFQNTLTMQMSKQQPRLGIHSPVRTNRYLNPTEQSAFKQINTNSDKSISTENHLNNIEITSSNDKDYLSNEINMQSSSVS